MRAMPLGADEGGQGDAHQLALRRSCSVSGHSLPSFPLLQGRVPWIVIDVSLHQRDRVRRHSNTRTAHRAVAANTRTTVRQATLVSCLHKRCHRRVWVYQTKR